MPKASPRSKMLKLPEIPSKPSTGTTQPGVAINLISSTFNGVLSSAGQSRGYVEGSLNGDHIEAEHNPFHMPSDVEVFAIREEERKAKQLVTTKMSIYFFLKL